MAEAAVHYLAIGHVTKDLTPLGPQLGGTVSFAALTARALDYSPGLVTACGPDLDLSRLAGLALTLVPSDESTTFENLYSAAGRTQFIRAQAAPLTAADIPLHWLRAPIVHLAPLAREVEQDLAASLSGSFVGLTPQGWMRRWDAEGRVTATPAAWPEAPDVLAHASAVVLSVDDIGGDWAVAERWARHARVLVITQSAEGCTVFVRGRGARQFPAPPQVEVDPTGAGDIFAAAFFINYYETDDPWASAQLANQVAALSVTRAGLDSVPTREEVGYCRTRAMRG
jgi:sugar/nucleoside kinase (ribokinase family)